LGRVDTLCFDKTGTLTQGRIGLRFVSDGTTVEAPTHLGVRRREILAAAARATPAGTDEALEHPTDQAVLDAATLEHIDLRDGAANWQRVDQIAFDSTRGFHATRGRTTRGGRLSVKGAPEVVLPRCVRWRTAAGIRPLDTAARRRHRAHVESLAKEGLRVL